MEVGGQSEDMVKSEKCLLKFSCRVSGPSNSCQIKLFKNISTVSKCERSPLGSSRFETSEGKVLRDDPATPAIVPGEIQVNPQEANHSLLDQLIVIKEPEVDTPLNVGHMAALTKHYGGHIKEDLLTKVVALKVFKAKGSGHIRWKMQKESLMVVKRWSSVIGGLDHCFHPVMCLLLGLSSFLRTVQRTGSGLFSVPLRVIFGRAYPPAFGFQRVWRQGSQRPPQAL